MPSLRESICAPNGGANLSRVNDFLEFIEGKLSADDYATAADLLWSAVDDVAAARRARGEPPP
jgi:hypothetical protein